jgi:hypothetical protein
MVASLELRTPVTCLVHCRGATRAITDAPAVLQLIPRQNNSHSKLCFAEGVVRA